MNARTPALRRGCRLCSDCLKWWPIEDMHTDEYGQDICPECCDCDEGDA